MLKSIDNTMQAIASEAYKKKRRVSLRKKRKKTRTSPFKESIYRSSFGITFIPAIRRHRTKKSWENCKN